MLFQKLDLGTDLYLSSSEREFHQASNSLVNSTSQGTIFIIPYMEYSVNGILVEPKLKTPSCREKRDKDGATYSLLFALRGAEAPLFHNCSYVPSLQPARYSSCSGVSLSILMLIDSSLSLATRLSSSSGTR
jgi:hypothetical protein